MMTTSGPVEGMKKETRRGGETEFTIKRSDFGMKTSIGPIGDEVKVSLAFSGVKQ
jgi:polyisoprenoid-binding protein YceI